MHLAKTITICSSLLVWRSLIASKHDGVAHRASAPESLNSELTNDACCSCGCEAGLASRPSFRSRRIDRDGPCLLLLFGSVCFEIGAFHSVSSRR